MNLRFLAITVFLQFCATATTIAQQVMLQGFYWDYPKTGQGYNWSDTLRLKAADLGNAGFTHVWFPPFAGTGNKSGGYDPQDLFIGNTTQTSLGTKQEIKDMVSAFTANNVKAVGDMVYNHRNGGKPETNIPAADYILYYAGNNNGSSQDPSQTEPNSSNTFKSPFPSDRYNMIIPIGGSTGLGVGTYYISFASRNAIYSGSQFMIHATTTKAGGGQAWDFVDNCIYKSNAVNITTDVAAFGNPYLIQLKQGYFNKIDSDGDVDEFQLTITSSDFNATGDTLVIQAVNLCGVYSNHIISKIWYTGTNSDIANRGAFNGTTDTDNSHKNLFNSSYKLQFQTFTDFSGLPSGRGDLHFSSFRPNHNTYGSSYAGGSSTTCLGPSWSMESMDYFYDYDHLQTTTRDTLIAWTKWAWDDLGVRALRMDAVKHFEPEFVGDMLNSMYAAGKTPDLVVGEWYGNEIQNQKNWINYVNARMTTATKAAIAPKVFDFTLRESLKNACDNGSDPRNVYYNGLNAQGMSGFNIITFLNNHDTRGSTIANGDALVWNNPMLGYAYILTNNQIGVPTVFYPDYYGYPAHNTTYGSDLISFDYFPTGLQPMKPEIDKLIKVLKNFINGSSSVDYLNHYGGLMNPAPSPNYWSSGHYYKSLLYQLNATGSAGGKEIVVAINFDTDTMKVNHLVAARNGIAQGTVFTDLLKNSKYPTSTIDNQNRIFIQLPPKSYTVFIQGDPVCYDLANLSKITPSASISTPTICEGNTINLASQGGTTYSWGGPSGFSSTSQNPVISSSTALMSGTYSVTISGCGTTSTSMVAVTINPNPSLTLTSINVQCDAGNNGSATVSVTSGTPNYSYLWNNSQITATATNLVAGTYTVSVTDANNCISTANVIITEPAALQTTVDISNPISNTNTTFQAKEYITANNQISGVARVDYLAGKSITLNPKFEVKAENGSVFNAKIQSPCPNNNLMLRNMKK